MKQSFSEKLEDGRIRKGYYASNPGDTFGQFLIQGPCGERLGIQASDAVDPESCGWEHVSVSTARRVPNWLEMCFVKDLFWEPEDCIVQFHPPQSEYVNNHPYVLHLWKHIDGFPMPPTILVGVKSRGILTKEEARQLRSELHEQDGSKNN